MLWACWVNLITVHWSWSLYIRTNIYVRGFSCSTLSKMDGKKEPRESKSTAGHNKAIVVKHFGIHAIHIIPLMRIADSFRVEYLWFFHLKCVHFFALFFFPSHSLVLVRFSETYSNSTYFFQRKFAISRDTIFIWGHFYWFHSHKVSLFRAWKIVDYQILCWGDHLNRSSLPSAKIKQILILVNRNEWIDGLLNRINQTFIRIQDHKKKKQNMKY